MSPNSAVPVPVPVLVAAAAVLGLVIGSFLNVVVYRAPRGMSIVRPGSSCTRCGALLGARENVPVLSWLVLRGRCRHCRAPISPRYPAVELVTGGGFAAMAWAVGPAAALAPLLAVTAVVVAASAIDHDGLPVPPMVLIAGLCGAAGLAAVAAADHGGGRLAWGAVGGAAAGLAASAALVGPGRRSRRARWPGTAATAALLGWCAGWLWPAGGLVLAGWVVAVALAGPALARLLAARRRGTGPSPALAHRAAPSSAQGRWLLVASFGAFWILVGGAAAHGP